MMHRFPLALAALLALGTAPALAEEAMTPETAAAALKAATGDELLKAAYATCLSLGNSGNDATEAFRLAGWEVDGDAETGFYEGAGPEEIYSLSWNDGGFCLIQSEIVGSERAAELLAAVLAGAGLSTSPAPDGECGAVILSGPHAGSGALVGVTSSGNDPTCVSAGTSGVGFTWDTGE